MTRGPNCCPRAVCVTGIPNVRKNIEHLEKRRRANLRNIEGLNSAMTAWDSVAQCRRNSCRMNCPEIFHGGREPLLLSRLESPGLSRYTPVHDAEAIAQCCN